MPATALVVIDMQRVMYETPGLSPWEGQRVLDNVLALLAVARGAGAPVVFVQHTAREDGHPLRRGEPGWPLLPALAQGPGEPVVEKHTFDAFHQTSLHETLAAQGARRAVLCGMQTEFCVDTTCRGGFAQGWDLILASDAHTTFDTEVLPARDIVAHHNRTLNGRFCTAMDTSEARTLLRP